MLGHEEAIETGEGSNSPLTNGGLLSALPLGSPPLLPPRHGILAQYTSQSQVQPNANDNLTGLVRSLFFSRYGILPAVHLREEGSK